MRQRHAVKGAAEPQWHRMVDLREPPPGCSLRPGDAVSLASWARICEASRREFEAIYRRLGVSLVERGESFYNPMLKVAGREGGRARERD